MTSQVKPFIPAIYKDKAFYLDSDEVPFLDWLVDKDKLLPLVLMQVFHITSDQNIPTWLDCEFYIDADSAFLLQCKAPLTAIANQLKEEKIASILEEAATDLLELYFPIDDINDCAPPFSIKLLMLSYSSFLTKHYSHNESVKSSALINYLFSGNEHVLKLNLCKVSSVQVDDDNRAENALSKDDKGVNGSSNKQLHAPELTQLLERPSVDLKALFHRLQLVVKVRGRNKPIDDIALIAAFMIVKPIRDGFKNGMSVTHSLTAPAVVNHLHKELSEAVSMQLCCNGENDGKSWFDIDLVKLTPSHFTKEASDILRSCCEHDKASDTFSWAVTAIKTLCDSSTEYSSTVFKEFISFNRSFHDTQQKRYLYSMLQKQMDSEIHGQSEVKKALVSALRQTLDGTVAEQRGPVFIYGASGVGKTSLTKVFANTLNKVMADSYSLQVINMEQYYHKNAALQLFGAGLQFNAANLGILTTPGEFIPKRIIVFDEIEKAHPNTLSSLLTLLSEYQARDSSSDRVIDFSECIFIFTSNLGEHTDDNGAITDYRSELSMAFSPEFINRLSRGFIAKAMPLEREDVKTLAKQLAHEMELSLKVLIEGDLSRAICMVAGELNPRAMLGAVAKLQTDIFNHLDEAVENGFFPIEKIEITFPGQNGGLTDFISKYHSRVWHATLEFNLPLNALEGRSTLVCKPPAPLVSLEDKRAPFMRFIEQTKCEYDDIIGNDESIDRIARIINTFNERCYSISNNEPDVPHILLTGPPGVGKTHLARAIANDFDGVFIHVNASEVTVGDADKNLQTIFSAAKKYAPSIVFIDEIDAIASKRQANTKITNMMVNSLLTGLDGFETNSNPVLVIGATNHPEFLDDAIVRAGRLSNRFTLGFPVLDELLAYVNGKIAHAGISKYTPYLLEAITDKLQKTPLSLVDTVFSEAIEKTCHGVGFDYTLMSAYMQHTVPPIDKSSKILSDKEQINAYHEAGHAIAVAELFSPSDVLYIDILPRENSEGMVVMTELQRKYSNTKANIKKQIQVLLAGRAAEQVFLNDPEQLSSGDASDIRHATHLAKVAIGQWGLGTAEEMIDYSQFSVNESELQQEVRSWIKEAYENVHALCLKKKMTLQRISSSLVKKRALYYPEIQQLLILRSINAIH